MSLEKGVNDDAYPVAVSQKVAKNLPVSFYSPTTGFKAAVEPREPPVDKRDQ